MHTVIEHFAGDDDHFVKIWNCRDNSRCVKVIKTGCTVSALKLCCTYLAVGSFNTSAMLWTVSTGEMLHRYVGHTSAVFCVNFNHFFDTFVSGSADETIILWSLTNATPLHSIHMSFRPSSVHFVFPSSIPQEHNTFILVANNSTKCSAWLLKFSRGNLKVTGVKLPYLTFNKVGVDVACNKTLILAFDSADCVIMECFISFQSSEKTSKLCNDTDSSASASVVNPDNRLNRCFQHLSLNTNDLMLLAAGYCFSVYVRLSGQNSELLIVRHNKSEPTELVGRWLLPPNCRWKMFFFVFVLQYISRLS